MDGVYEWGMMVGRRWMEGGRKGGEGCMNLNGMDGWMGGEKTNDG